MEEIKQRIEALEKRIAALELALKSGKEGVDLYARVRKPYQNRYTFVKVGSVGYLEDK